ncbi:hypothetical protein MMC18_007708 [Xylographa bjoerkii]|nr:hypothetical protein [Xylographa bjoerkii]
MAIYRAGSTVVRSYSISCYTATIRVSHLLSGLQRVSVAHNTLCNSLSSPSHFRPYSVSHIAGKRTFATRPASRPKAHTGRTTTSPRVRKPKATTTTTTTTTTAAGKVEEGASQPTKIKSQGAKGKAKVPAKPRSKPKAKAKTVKPKPTAKVKKPLTVERVAAKAAQEKRKQLRELKILALSPPKGPPTTPFLIINTELSKEKHTVAGKEAAEKYKNLIPEELEHYNHIAHQNKVTGREAYETWIQSLTPDDIRKANNARNTLTRLGIKGFPHLKDERQVKRPVAAHNLFLKERYNSGDMQGMGLADATRLIMREWRELGDSDKQKYYETQSQSRARYVQEVKATYHRDVDLSAATPTHPATAPAA